MPRPPGSSVRSSGPPLPPRTPRPGRFHFSDDDALQDPTPAFLRADARLETNRRIGTPEPPRRRHDPGADGRCPIRGRRPGPRCAPADLDRAAPHPGTRDRIRFDAGGAMRGRDALPGRTRTRDTGIDVRSSPGIDLDRPGCPGHPAASGRHDPKLLAGTPRSSANPPATGCWPVPRCVITTTGATLRDHARRWIRARSGGSPPTGSWPRCPSLLARRCSYMHNPATIVALCHRNSPIRGGYWAYEFNDLAATHPGCLMIIVPGSAGRTPTVRKVADDRCKSRCPIASTSLGPLLPPKDGATSTNTVEVSSRCCRLRRGVLRGCGIPAAYNDHTIRASADCGNGHPGRTSRIPDPRPVLRRRPGVRDRRARQAVDGERPDPSTRNTAVGGVRRALR